MTIARASGVASMLVASLAAVGCGAGDGFEAGETSAALTAPAPVANVAPSGLIESTGNLYWTANGRTLLPRQYWARVYRTGKTSAPGSEAILYAESSLYPVHFGDITFANVGGAYYGYFAANYGSSGEIKRVPLAGGSATHVATASGPVGRVVTDGTSLFWADGTSLRRTDFSSGATYLLASISGITSLGLDGLYVYFSAGNTIYKTRKAGSAVYTVLTRSSPITAIAVQAGATSADTTVYWAEDRYVLAYYHYATTFWGGPTIGNAITSLSFDGSRVLWTYCTTTNTSCYAEYRNNPYAGSGVAVGNAANFIQGDSSAFFYGTNSGVFRVYY